MFRTLRFASSVLTFSILAWLAGNPRLSADNSAWSRADNMTAARSGACAALLPDGRVLITGGEGNSGVLASAELLNTTGGFSSASSMAFPRAGHSCVSLPGGRILVAGGRTDGNAAINAAEVYDPATDSWHISASMISARAGATASLLKDGRVLIAGGESSGEAILTLEIYDPSSGKFLPVWRPLSSPRKDHAAAVLKDGRVVIAGGSDGSTPLDSVDIFDPATGEVSAIGKLLAPRVGLTATTLLDGSIFFAGGNNGSGDLASTEIFDPASGRFSPAAAMDMPRRGHVAFRIPNNNAVLIVGGNSGGKPTATTGLYIPWTNSYRPGAPLSLGRSAVAATALKQNGAVMLAGGSTPNATTQTVEVTVLPTIMTDKPDYSPGETVKITGANWTPGATVSLKVTRVADNSVRWGPTDVTADGAGNVSSQFTVADADLGLTFALTATEPSSGKTAQVWTFTDGTVSGATITIKNAACTADQSSFALGSTVCASSTVTVQGGGTGDYRIQWYAPGYVPGSSTNPVQDTLFKNVTNNSTQTDSFQPTTGGTWTVVACKTSNPGNCSTGNIVNGTGTTFTVVPSSSLAVSSATGTYGGTVTLTATLNSTAAINGKTISFTLNGTSVGTATTVASGVATLNSVSLGSINAGTYPGGIGANFAGDGSLGASSGTADLTINKAGLSIAADAKTKVYGNADPALTYQITSGSLFNGDTLSGTLTRAAGETVGGSPYAIQQGTLAAGVNYTLTFTGANLTITTRPITLVADAKTKVYGSADPALTFTVGGSGLAVGDTITSVLTGALTRAAGETVAGSPYAITQGTLLANGNYNITAFTAAALTITQKAASVTPNAAIKTYGDAEPALSGSLTGFLPADSVTATYSRTAGETVGGSPYVISATLGPANVLGNYSIAYSTANFTINKRPASVTPNAGGKVYGDVDPALTGNLSGFLPADGVTAAYSRTAGDTAVGSPYTISAILTPAAVLGNYSITYNTASFTISRKNASVTPNAASKIYGDVDPAFTGTLNGFVTADGISAAYSRPAGETVAGSPYTISAALTPTAVLGNYNITYNTASFTISRKNASVTPNAASKTYGDVDPAFTGALSGFVSADNVTAAYSRTAGETVAGSPYTISATLSPAGVLGNYNITYSTANFTINARPITITAQDKTKVYGEPDPPLTFTVGGSGLAGGDTIATAFSGGLTRAPGSSVAGSPYAISQGSLLATSNYSVTGFTPAALVISPRPITVTAEAKTKMYGEANPVLTYVVGGSGLAAGDTAAAVFTGALTRALGENVPGPYAITQGNLTANSNYGITSFIAAALTITPRPASVTPTAASKMYGDPDPALTGTLTGFLAADGVTATYSRVPGETVTGSPYAISATLSPAGVLSNYNITYNAAGFTINKRPASVTPTAAGKIYGDPDPALSGTLTGFLAADGVTAAYNRAPGETVTGSPYAISATLSPAGVLNNYNITYNTAGFTITPKTASVTASAASKIYGDADPALSGTLTGFLATDNVTANFSRTPGETVAGSPYTISATLSPAGVLGNYNITYNAAGFTINKRPASVTVSAASKTYGDADPAFTGTLTGFLATDNVTANLSRTAGETVAGSQYTISATLSPAGVLGNYNITYSTANFTINPRPITITAQDKTKVYGEPDPPLTFTVGGSGLAGGDTIATAFSGGLTRAAGETVTGASYAISQGSLLATSNYSVTGFTPAALVISPRPITVTAEAKTKMYGEANPVLTYVVGGSGLAAGDTAAGVFTGALARAAGENVPGPYAITKGTLAANGNYGITSFTPAALTVTARPLTITANSKTKPFGSANPPLDATYAGFVPGEGPGNLAGTLLCTTTATASSLVANNPYPITCSGQSSTNYAITYLGGILMVTNTPPTVGVNNSTVTAMEGSTASNTGLFSDPELNDVVIIAASVGSVTQSAGHAGAWSWSYATKDGPAETGTVTITATDANGAYSFITFALTVNNAVPVVSITTPVTGTLYTLNGTVNVSASFTDAGKYDNPHTCTINWDDGTAAETRTVSETAGSGTGTCEGSRSFSKPGVYTIVVTITDKDGGIGTAQTMAVFYDPNAGFVTGGGWINSPVYPALPYMQTAGKANFGFVSKYQKGQSAPDGNTEFQFKEGNFNFHSTDYQWLVIAGPKAQFKGTGTVNGSGNYGFMLTATDGSMPGGGGVDKFRIKVWDINNGGAIVYDNAYGSSDDIDAANPQALSGGSIVIHSK